MPKVSIIVPVYDVEKYLSQCLDSLVQQTYSNIEIIVINDGSFDNSKKIIEQYAKQFSNIKFINNSENLGLSKARNIGLDYANGEYIFFIDSDDWINRNTIERLVYLATTYNSKIVETNHTNVIGNFKKIAKVDPEIEIENLQENPMLLREKKSYVWNKLYDHNLIGDFRFPNGIIFEDIAFTYPILTKVDTYIHTNESLYNYRRRLGGITLTSKFYPSIKLFDILKSNELIIETCKKMGTYEHFKNPIREITQNFSLHMLLNSETWFQFSREDKMHYLYYLTQYLEEEYNIKNFENWDLVKKRCEQDRIYRYRLNFLKHQLNMAKKYPVTSEEPLEEAKRIITKYQK